MQRLPSVLGALLAILATYWGGAKLVGREAAFIGGAALALSFLLVFEAHIAKTDAVLCGLSALCFASLATIRTDGGSLSLWTARPAVWVFWAALGVSILIKGPVVPSLVAMTVATLLIWERRGYGLKVLLNIPAISLCLLLFIPWAIAIGIETQGAFFVESLGNDFGGKLVRAQESHPGPPGYHLALLSLTLWPGSLLLFPAIAMTVQNLRRNIKSDTPISKALRLCVAWIIPFWILIELMPTKLPHYILPLFPALCVLIGWAGTTLLKINGYKKTRYLGAFIFFIISFLLLLGLSYALTFYSSRGADTLYFGVIAGILTLVLFGAGCFWKNKIKLSFRYILAAALITNITAYGFVLPNLDRLQLADRLADSFEVNDLLLPRQGGPLVQSINFTEPSFVYQFGKEVRLGDQVDLENPESWTIGHIFIVDDLESDGARFDAFQRAAEKQQSCLNERDTVRGYNYSRGDAVNLGIFEVVACTES